MTDKNKLRVASIVFLILGFEIGTFCYKSAVIKLAANRDKPDTIYVFKAEKVYVEAEYISEYTGSLMIPNTPSNGVGIVFMADSEWKGTYTYTF